MSFSFQCQNVQSVVECKISIKKKVKKSSAFSSLKLKKRGFLVLGLYLVLQIVIVTVMQKKAEDIAGVDHSIDPALFQFLAKPALHWTQ